jgi:hypothetical protein
MKRFFFAKKALHVHQKSETTLGISKLTAKKAVFSLSLW